MGMDVDKVVEVDDTPGVAYMFCVCVPLIGPFVLPFGIMVDPEDAGVVYTVCMVVAGPVVVLEVVGATLKAKSGKASAVILLDRICILLLLL